ncbi:MAG: hypothetical protein EB075_08930 [Bacteroidetes bacterium]|nr:hypothetical protein [Bacteroidota bacterium]
MHETMQLSDVQFYVPIYQKFFELTANNADRITLNHAKRVVRFNERKSTFVYSIDVHTTTKVETIDTFIKCSPLFDPLKYMCSTEEERSDTGAYACELPKFIADPKTQPMKHLKVPAYDVNNPAYIDAFFNHLSGLLLHEYMIPNAIDCYGIYTAIHNELPVNVIDDLDELVENENFSTNRNVLYEMGETNSRSASNMMRGSRACKKRLILVPDGECPSVTCDETVVDVSPSVIGQQQGQEKERDELLVDVEEIEEVTECSLEGLTERAVIEGGEAHTETNQTGGLQLENEEQLETTTANANADVNAIELDLKDIRRKSSSSSYSSVSSSCSSRTSHTRTNETIPSSSSSSTYGSESDSWKPFGQAAFGSSDYSSSQDSASYASGNGRRGGNRRLEQKDRNKDRNESDKKRAGEGNHKGNNKNKKKAKSSNRTTTDSDDEEGKRTEDASASDEVDDNSDLESNDEPDMYFYLNLYNVPSQVMLLEKCEGTVDSLIIDEDFSDAEIEAMLAQIILTLAIYQRVYQFTHNDLHSNNIMYVKTDRQYLYYCYNKTYYKIPTYGRIYKIIDFGRAIYTYRGELCMGRCFEKGADASNQYNYGPYYRPEKPVIEPNYSFDLCRFACSIFDTLIDVDDDLSNLKCPLKRLIHKWCLDDSGKSVLYKKNDVERYPRFKLYKMISRIVHRHTPEVAIKDAVFKKYVVTRSTLNKKARIVNVDALPELWRV